MRIYSMRAFRIVAFYDTYYVCPKCKEEVHAYEEHRC